LVFTLWTSQRLLATEGRRSTRSRQAATDAAAGSASGSAGRAARRDANTLGGSAPSTSARGKSTATVPSRESSTTTRPSPETAPTTLNGQFSRAHSAAKSASSRRWSNSALFSWYSAPQISMTLRVGSPTSTFRMSYLQKENTEQNMSDRYLEKERKVKNKR
jgi:hypothetical protein